MTMKYYGPLALWVGCRTQVLVAIVCESSVQYADVWQSSLNKLIKKLHDVVGIIATQHVYGLREDEKCIIFSKYCCCWNPCTCWVYDAELFTYLSPIHLASDRGDLLQGVRKIQRARLSCICRGFPSARFIKFRGLWNWDLCWSECDLLAYQNIQEILS